MEKKILPVGPIEANCVILWNPEGPADGARPCWLVDPGADAEDIVCFCEARGLKPALVAFTHGHFDHIGAVTDLLAKWPGVPVHIAPGDEALAFSRANAWPPHYRPTARPATLTADLVDGAEISAGGLAAKVVATPGHTPGGICLHFADANLLLTGDTLFAGSCGRTDFPGGSMEVLAESLTRLATFPPETEVVPGHGASTTIGREVETNPFLA